MVRAIVLHALLFLCIAQCLSKPASLHQFDNDQRQVNSAQEERFGLSSSMSFGVDPGPGLGGYGEGQDAYPNVNYGSGIGGGMGNFGGYGYAPPPPPPPPALGYNGGGYGNARPAYNGGYGNVPPGYNGAVLNNNYGSSYGGAAGYGTPDIGYESGFACGSICGEHMRRCNASCSKGFWTYSCALCFGPKWDNCRSCFP